MSAGDDDRGIGRILGTAVAWFVAAGVLFLLGHVMPLYVTVTVPGHGPTPGLTPPACCAAPCPGHMSDGCPGASHGGP